MLNLSQLELGNFKLIKEEFFMNELVSSSVKKFSAIFKQKDIEVNLNLKENLKVYGGWNRIEQVIKNFLINALRHTEYKGKIFVNVLEREGNVITEIENTGSNIPQDELDKIWHRFYKGDKSRNRELGGTGLGLSIVKNILLFHKSDFGVTNTNRGVKFYFAVPKISH